MWPVRQVSRPFGSVRSNVPYPASDLPTQSPTPMNGPFPYDGSHSCPSYLTISWSPMQNIPGGVALFWPVELVNTNACAPPVTSRYGNPTLPVGAEGLNCQVLMSMYS